jgi:hypothetical protein
LLVVPSGHLTRQSRFDDRPDARSHFCGRWARIDQDAAPRVLGSDGKKALPQCFVIGEIAILEVVGALPDLMS